MTTSLVLTFVGDDRPGLVNAVSEKVVDFGGTWLESRSVRLAGKFAGVPGSAFWISRILAIGVTPPMASFVKIPSFSESAPASFPLK